MRYAVDAHGRRTVEHLGLGLLDLVVRRPREPGGERLGREQRDEPDERQALSDPKPGATGGVLVEHENDPAARRRSTPHTSGGAPRKAIAEMPTTPSRLPQRSSLYASNESNRANVRATPWPMNAMTAATVRKITASTISRGGPFSVDLSEVEEVVARAAQLDREEPDERDERDERDRREREEVHLRTCAQEADARLRGSCRAARSSRSTTGRRRSTRTTG